MPPEWVLQQFPDDGTPASRLALAFWFLWLPAVWLYQAAVIAPVAPLIGQAIVVGTAQLVATVFRMVLFGCLGVLLLVVVAFILSVTIALIFGNRRPA